MSLDSLELLVEIENNFGVEFSTPEAESMETVGDFHELILEKLKLPISEREIVLKQLKSIISETTGIEINDIKYESSVTRDLGID